MTARRQWFLFAGLAYAVIIGAVILGLSQLYSAAQERLDEAMGDRLLAVADALAIMTDSSSLFNLTIDDPTETGYADSLLEKLKHIRHADNLAEITLCTPEGVVLVSTAASQLPGQKNDFWELDKTAVEMAGQGFSQATKLYRLQETFQKSAHAPVLLEDPVFGEPLVVGIITVSGSPDFFESLARLRKAAYLTGAVVLVVLILMGGILYRIDLALQRYRLFIQRQETLATMGRMTAGIAHEIRNPLGIIRATGQHLERVLSSAGVKDPAATFIPEEVDRLDQILTGYLSFSTEKASEDVVFDLFECLQHTANLVTREFAADGTSISLPEPLPNISVLGNSQRMQQVLLNLLLNARDAMSSGGLIECFLITENDQVLLEVRDQGTGLTAGNSERLFDPFFSGKEKGSGLGLATSLRIVTDMRGKITLVNRTDCVGCCARIRLPLAK